MSSSPPSDFDDDEAPAFIPVEKPIDLEQVTLEGDVGAQLMKGLVRELLRRLSNPALAASLSAAEMTLIAKVCSDNSISLASIRRGDFGQTAQRVAEEFPFQAGAVLQ